MGKLTQYQSAALAKLTNEWQSAYELKFSIATLDNLYRRGLADRRLENGATFPGFERTSTKYRLKKPNLQGIA